MSFRINDVSNEQIVLNERILSLTERERKYLESSWAVPFADILFPAIDETPYEVLFSESYSRPNTPVNIIICGLILKEMLNLSDDSFVQSTMFDIRLQYALHTLSYEEQPFSDRTFSRFRRRCLEYENETGIDLIHNTVISLADKISVVMNIGFKTIRMDSMMIESNIRKLSRLELIYVCLSNYAKTLTDLPDELCKYQSSSYENELIYHNQKEDTESKISVLLKDADILLDTGIINDEYHTLKRVIEEQSIIDNEIRKLKEETDPTLNSEIIQSPYDKDATFRRKQGKTNHGYSCNFVETVNGKESVITDYQYGKNIVSDTTFGKEAISNIQKQEEESILVADGAYCSYELINAAKEKNISIINTNLTGRKPNPIDCEFIITDTSVICPNGYETENITSFNNTYTLKFDSNICNNCPRRNECRPHIGKKYSTRNISDTRIQRAKQIKFRENEEFKRLSAIRNGVESIPSVMRRKYKADKMPVRGLLKTRLWFRFKIAAFIFTKLCHHWQGLQGVNKNLIEQEI